MTKGNNAEINEEAPSLIFDWRRPPRLLAPLGGFLLLSLLVHLLGFYFFHVVYQPAVSLPPTERRITVLPPDAKQNAAFFEWLDSENPAIPATPRQVVPGIPPLIPSFGAKAPPLLAELSGFAVPPPEATIDSGPSVMRLVPAPALGTELVPTKIEITPRKATAWMRVGEGERARIPLSPLLLPPLESARFQVGIHESGQVRFVLLEKSSGSSEADQRAETFLRSARFSEGGAFRWESVSVRWGWEAMP